MGADRRCGTNPARHTLATPPPHCTHRAADAGTTTAMELE
jgi:hypothetical protein